MKNSLTYFPIPFLLILLLKNFTFPLALLLKVLPQNAIIMAIMIKWLMFQWGYFHCSNWPNCCWFDVHFIYKFLFPDGIYEMKLLNWNITGSIMGMEMKLEKASYGHSLVYSQVFH